MASQPTEQLRSGHIPAELYRQLPDGATVHVVISTPIEHRFSVSPLALLSIVCGSLGVAATIYLLTQAIYAAVPFAGISVGGVTIALKRKS